MKNNICMPTADIPFLDEADFQEIVGSLISQGGRISSFFADIEADYGPRLFIIISDDEKGGITPLSMKVDGGRFESMTCRYEQFHLFEREIHEQSEIVPTGHPWLKPVRFPDGNPGLTDFFRLEGDETHQVAVGPVHAGIIEPGHFRFQCHGETVHHLETSHGYQHRGIEEKLIGGPFKDTIHIMGVIAGDSTAAHTAAYAQVVESLSSEEISLRSEAVRAVALELERCANHIGDLGALAGDIGYLPTSAFCGRIRGDFLNMSALLCGNRFSRGLIVPGGCGFDLDEGVRTELGKRLSAGKRDFINAVSLLWDTPSVLARFDSAGRISRETAAKIGMVGPAARASGLKLDVRRDHPFGYYKLEQIPVSTSDMGNVSSRAWVRWLEVQESISFMEKLLEQFPDAVQMKPTVSGLRPDSLSVSLTEGWRGEVCHTALTDGEGRFRRYKIVDPSFHNWLGLALSMRGGQISDFPLCNKSFNLSYCGLDL